MSVPSGFFASGVLRDGKVFAVGGEVSGANSDISSGDIYDPAANLLDADGRHKCSAVL
jgi:hypothetical protein